MRTALSTQWTTPHTSRSSFGPPTCLRGTQKNVMAGTSKGVLEGIFMQVLTKRKMSPWCCTIFRRWSITPVGPLGPGVTVEESTIQPHTAFPTLACPLPAPHRGVHGQTLWYISQSPRWRVKYTKSHMHVGGGRSVELCSQCLIPITLGDADNIRESCLRRALNVRLSVEHRCRMCAWRSHHPMELSVYGRKPKSRATMDVGRLEV